MEQTTQSNIGLLYDYYNRQFRYDLKEYFSGSTACTIPKIDNVNRVLLELIGKEQRGLFSLFVLLDIVLQKATLEMFDKKILTKVARKLKLPAMKAISENPEMTALDVLGAAGLKLEKLGSSSDGLSTPEGDAIEILYKEIETKLQLGQEDPEPFKELKEKFRSEAWDILSAEKN